MFVCICLFLSRDLSFEGFPDSSVGKESTCNAGDPSLIPGLGRSPGERNGYPLQYSGLENSMDCIVHGVTKSQTQLSDFHFHRQEIRNYECIYVRNVWTGNVNTSQRWCNTPWFTDRYLTNYSSVLVAFDSQSLSIFPAQGATEEKYSLGSTVYIEGQGERGLVSALLDATKLKSHKYKK